MANNNDVTFQELLDYLGVLIDQKNSDGSFNTSGNVPQETAYMLLNQGIQHAAKILIEVKEDYYMDKFETHTTANQMEYPMPSNLRMPQMVFIDFTGTGTNLKRCNKINIKHLNEINNLNSDFSKDEPSYYLRGWRTVGILPAPTVTTSGSDEKCLKVWGVRLPEKIESATSTVQIPRQAIETVALYAANRLMDNSLSGELKNSQLELQNFIQPRGEEYGEITKVDSIWDDAFNNYEEYNYLTQ